MINFAVADCTTVCMDRQNAYILIGVTTLILTPKFATWK